jgi:hypothetical protein
MHRRADATPLAKVSFIGGAAMRIDPASGVA